LGTRHRSVRPPPRVSLIKEYPRACRSFANPRPCFALKTPFALLSWSVIILARASCLLSWLRGVSKLARSRMGDASTSQRARSRPSPSPSPTADEPLPSVLVLVGLSTLKLNEIDTSTPKRTVTCFSVLFVCSANHQEKIKSSKKECVVA
jgi:hypothetical protein